MEHVIKFSDVSVTYGAVKVLRNVNLIADKGEIVYLIGRSGSGKSTLLKSLYADALVSDGSASILDYNLNSLREKDIPFLRRKLGMVFQDFKLLSDRSVDDNLAFVLRATDTSDKKQIETRISEVLHFVGMENKGYKMPHELSGGEQQRVVIARALINSPQVLLADEPTGNLDPHTGHELMSLIYQVAKNGTTVVMATHNMRWVNMFPGRVLHCENGEVNEYDASKLANMSLEDYYNL